jgi:hypothetical protein
MGSMYRNGNRITFKGFKGIIVSIMETYRKNVIVIKVESQPKGYPKNKAPIAVIRLFEYPDGKLELMNQDTKYDTE